MSNQIGSLKMGQKFKKTPAGEIPVDWNVTSFEDAFDFLRTANNSRDDLDPTEEIGYIHYGDIHTKWRTKLQCDRVELPRISKSKVEKTPTLQDGDLVMADASEDYDGIGVSVEVSKVGNQRVVAGLHTILLRDKGGRFADGFRGYIQYVPSVHQSLVKIATGGSVYGVSKGNLLGISIPCPPLTEQKKIAAILSAVDEFVDKVATEIEKTKELKKGMMCQLLTRGIGHGKFKNTLVGEIPADWNVKKIEEIAQLYSGGTPYREKAEYFGGTVPWVKSGELNRSPITKTDECITEAGLQNSSAKLVPENTVLIALYGATAGQVAMLRIKAAINQAILAVLPTAEISKDYIYFLLKFMSPKLISITQGSGQPNLSQELIARTDIPIPPISEQVKIADILYGLDAKLTEATEGKTKIEELKKGLMNMLLTGKVRVI